MHTSSSVTSIVAIWASLRTSGGSMPLPWEAAVRVRGRLSDDAGTRRSADQAAARGTQGAIRPEVEGAAAVAAAVRVWRARRASIVAEPFVLGARKIAEWLAGLERAVALLTLPNRRARRARKKNKKKRQ
jgi:hypothetical protein